MSDELSVIGKALPKVDSLGKTTGRARYTEDLVLPEMLFGRLLRTPHPHARIRRIDTGRARALPGVRAVLTGRDLPTKYGILPSSQDETALAEDVVRYVGEPVAAVAADDEETAERALGAIDVEYEPLPAITSIEEALQNRTVRIHDQADGTNIHKAVNLEFGDVAGGFARADHIREDVFFYEGSNHVAMEQHAVLASVEAGGKLTVWSSTQVPLYLHGALQKVLGLPANMVRVIAPPVGGGFGGKSDIFSHEIVAAKLAMVTQRPVKIACSREEVFYLHRGRHPVLMKIRTGFTKEGRITAMHFRSILDGGAYGSYGVASTYYTGVLQPTTYRIPAYKFEGVRVFTNKPPCGPKRGHGTPQPRFALETHLDKAAEDLGLGPEEIRYRNLVRPFSMTVNHLRITSCGLKECMEQVLAASKFREKRGHLGRGKGIGLAVSAYLSGAALPIWWNEDPHSEVEVRIEPSGHVVVSSLASEIGQGSTSMLAFIVAEVLGLEPGEIEVVVADTDRTPTDLGSYSSRVTFMAGNAALSAATKARQVVFDVVAGRLDIPTERLVAKGRRIGDASDPHRGFTWHDAIAAAASGGPITAMGSYKPPKLAGPYKGSGVGPSPAYSFSACVIEATCDTETGFLTADRIWLAHDIGRAINLRAVEGQIEGSICMGLGEALLEQQSFRGGLLKSPSILEQRVPTILEMPEIHTFLVETVDPEGPFGAKEVGQGPLLPVAPALANALYDAVGVRIDEVPMTPDKILRALEEQGRGHERPRVGPRGFPDLPLTKEPLRVPPPAEDTVIPGRVVG
ncbi:MAG TPA: molybdopterin cofactor-binding domain-containing protein [Thermoplasmata archaeon]|nr:molybdopterin cofactor-binding domain-containing protein [Thermoplasmata archaeon]